MPFIEPTERFADPPRLPGSESARSDWDGDLDLDRGYATLRGVRIEGEMDLRDCEQLELIDCELENVSFLGAPGIELDIDRCLLSTCDLGPSKGTGLRQTELRGCRLAGTDWSAMNIEDVLVRGGAMRYANLRMAKLQRVAFDGVSFDDVDLYDSVLNHVSFDRCSLQSVVFNKARLHHVDLREATRLEITAASGLEGALISDTQVVELAYLFALASGVSIERRERP